MSEPGTAKEATAGAWTLERALALALAVVAVFALWRSWQLGQTMPGLDYYQFWVVGEAIEHDGVSNPYLDAERARVGGLYLERAEHLDPASRRHAAAQGRAVLETYSTPFLYTAMHALASGDYERDYTRWHRLSLLAFTAAILGFARIVGLGWSGALAIFATITLLGAPFQSETQVANVNRVQLGVLALAAGLALRGGSTANAAALGGVLAVCAMFKPNVAFALLLVAVAVSTDRGRREFAALCGGSGAAVLICFALSVSFYGSASAWAQWAGTLAVIPDEVIHVSLGNYAALPLLLPGASSAASIVAAGALCLPILVGLVRRPASKNDREFARLVVTTIGLGCVIALMSATLVWEHYFLLALPLLIVTSSNAGKVATGDAIGWLRFRILPAIAFLALLATPTHGIAGLPHETYFPLVQGSALVLLYGLGVWSIASPVATTADHAEQGEPR